MPLEKTTKTFLSVSLIAFIIIGITSENAFASCVLIEDNYLEPVQESIKRAGWLEKLIRLLNYLRW